MLTFLKKFFNSLLLSLLVMMLVSCNLSKKSNSELAFTDEALEDSSQGADSKICEPLISTTLNCTSQIAFAQNAGQSRTCSKDGSQYLLGQCTLVSCSNGYIKNGNVCVAQSCQPNQTQELDCSSSIQNANVATRIDTCKDDGSSYNIGTCQLVSCNNGYSISNNKCIANNGDTGPNGVRRWSTLAFPLTISISNELSSQEQVAVYNALDEWDQVVPEHKFFNDNVNIVSDPKCYSINSYNDSTIGIYIVDQGDNFEYFPDTSNALAVAISWMSNNSSYTRISHSDIFFNKKNFEFATDGSSNKSDFGSVAVHELGHLLGLDHSQTGPSVLLPSLSRGTIKRDLFQLDIDRIRSNYIVSANSSSAKSSSQLPVGSTVRVIMELTVDKKCNHYIDDVFTYSHEE